jgi:hypothetical protein
MCSFVDCTSQNIIIQGDSGEKMIISIIVRKKFYECVSNSKLFARVELSKSANTEVLWMVIKTSYSWLYCNFTFILKWQICYTEMTSLLQFTINIWKSHCRSQCTLQLACEDRMLFVWVDLHVSLCRQQHPKCERVICLVYLPFFLKLCSSSKPTNKNVKELCLEIQTTVPQ